MTTKEKYYAVRIGDPRYHRPYFMLRDEITIAPQLFTSRESAEKEAEKLGEDKIVRVVRVWLHDGSCK